MPATGATGRSDRPPLRITYRRRVRNRASTGVLPSHRDFAINPVSIVVIDLETGDFEVDMSEIAACDRLEATHPDAQIWIVGIGLGYVRHFGGRAKRIG